MLNLRKTFCKIGVMTSCLIILGGCNQVTETRKPRLVTQSQSTASSSDQVPAQPIPIENPADAPVDGDAILAIHTPAPPSCIGCHENKRPNETHYAGQDCVSCHKYPNFSGGFFAHAPKPEKCEICHARPATVGLRAYPNVGTPVGFNPNNAEEPGSGHYRGKDCVSCHASPADNATQFTFAHAKQSPESCMPCHFREGNREHNGDNRGVMLTGFGNCFNCHKNFDQTVRRNWGRQ